MRKRIAALALAAVMAFGLTACGGGSSSSTAASAGSGDAAGGVSGEFTGTATGMGEVSVTITLTDGVITGCEIVGDSETEGIGSVIVENAPEEIVSGNKGAIDVVSGATITSNAVNEALAAALAAAGLDAADFTGSGDAAAAEDRVVDTDIVIVGAGGAGMTAAIAAANEGKNVVIVESQAMVGGNSVRSTGGMNAAKTPAQDENEFAESAGVEKTLETAASEWADNEAITALADTVAGQWAEYQANPVGYFDSVELMELDTLIGGHGTNDPALVEALCSNSADAIAWLSEQGIELTSVSSFGGASVKRIHRPVDSEGKTISVGSYMIPLLQAKCEELGVEFIMNTTANEILTDANGAAVGIAATDKNGAAVTVNAKAVILATGGFGANLDMVVEYKPDLAGFMTTNAPGAQGQGIDMAVAIGAGTVDMDQIQIHPTVEANTAAGQRRGQPLHRRGGHPRRGLGRRDRPDRQLQLAGHRPGHGRRIQRHPGLHQQRLHRDRRDL